MEITSVMEVKGTPKEAGNVVKVDGKEKKDPDLIVDGGDMYQLMSVMGKLKGDGMFAHQRYMLDYMARNPGKNMAFLWEPGTGKTPPVARIAVKGRYQRVVYLAPASLHPMFREHIQGNGGNPSRIDPDGQPHFSTVTSNAGNVYTQWTKAVEGVLGKLPSLERYYEKIRQKPSSTGEPEMPKEPIVLCIIDEAHQFSARVAGVLNTIYYARRDDSRLMAESKEAYLVYRHICYDTRVQVIVLTGTPIQNHPFNAVPMFNMLVKEFTGSDGRRATAFPERFGSYYNSFLRGSGDLYSPGSFDENRWLVETDSPTVQKQANLYMSRIQNLVMWYEAPKGLPSAPFPLVKENKRVYVTMSDFQANVYSKLESEEQSLEDSLRSMRPGRVTGEPIVEGASVFRTFTRQASNFAFLKELYAKHKRNAAAMLVDMPDDAFDMKNLGTYSCKAKAIMDKILKEKDKIHCIYSHFVAGAGTSIFERVLKRLGFISLNEAITRDKVDAYADLKMVARGKTVYALLTGEVEAKLKQKIINVMNDAENAKLRLVRVILYSGAASHGLSFKSVEMVHFFEEQWDEEEEEQAFKRSARINSAMYLPPERRYLSGYHYVAILPSGIKSMSVDEYMHGVAKRKKLIATRTLEWIKSAAINCHGLFDAENALHSSYIKSKKLPPERTFFQCAKCSTHYHPSYFIQETIENKCDHTRPSPPPKPIHREHEGEKYLLDNRTGLAWRRIKVGEKGSDTTDILVTDKLLLQILWRQELSLQ